MERLYLPQLTLVAITDRDHGKTIEAIDKTLQRIQPLRTILFSDVFIDNPSFECLTIEPLRSVRKYNEFVVWRLGHYIESSHILLIQHDGYVIDETAWTDEFLEYDYIGAPWGYKDGRNVGNGGFSMRSKRLHDILATDKYINIGSPEDEIICRLFRHYLEEKHGIKFAPEELAHRFSFELHAPKCKTFGFHNSVHKPYREPIVLRRTGALGDVIMLEPVMAYFYEKGYRVILDCLPQYFNLFFKHQYPVEHLAYLPGEDFSECRIINFDMAYESMPQQLVLRSYFLVAGVENPELRNSELNYHPTHETKLFEKYIVIHIDDSDVPHRNVHGVDWEVLERWLQSKGYAVIQVGRKPSKKAGLRINTSNESMLAYVICGADLFIGVDSGPSQIAVACGIKSVIFFGSVNPDYRYYDRRNITIVQNECEFAGCYHNQISVRGVDCVIDKETPPCTNHSTDIVISKISALL